MQCCWNPFFPLSFFFWGGGWVGWKIVRGNDITPPHTHTHNLWSRTSEGRGFVILTEWSYRSCHTPAWRWIPEIHSLTGIQDCLSDSSCPAHTFTESIVSLRQSQLCRFVTEHTVNSVCDIFTSVCYIITIMWVCQRDCSTCLHK